MLPSPTLLAVPRLLFCFFLASVRCHASVRVDGVQSGELRKEQDTSAGDVRCWEWGYQPSAGKEASPVRGWVCVGVWEAGSQGEWVSPWMKPG